MSQVRGSHQDCRRHQDCGRHQHPERRQGWCRRPGFPLERLGLLIQDYQDPRVQQGVPEVVVMSQGIQLESSNLVLQEAEAVKKTITMAPITLDDLRDEMAKDKDKTIMTTLKAIDEMISGSRPKFPSHKEISRDGLIKACQFLKLQLTEALEKDGDFMSASDQTESPDQNENQNENEPAPSKEPELSTSTSSSSPGTEPTPAPKASENLKTSRGTSSAEENVPNCRFHKWRECKNKDSCKFKHPELCQKFLQHGLLVNNAEQGCDRKCNLYHPPICYGSLKFRECKTKKCRKRHLPETKFPTKVTKETKEAEQLKAQEAKVPETKAPKAKALVNNPSEVKAREKKETSSSKTVNNNRTKSVKKPSKGTRATKPQQSRFSREPIQRRPEQVNYGNQQIHSWTQMPPPTVASPFLGQSQLEQRLLQIEKLLLMRPLINQTVIPQGVQFSF